MRPRQSGGGTAQDPVNITSSDPEPVSSDAPRIISSTKTVPLQSSSSDVIEVANGKRVRPAEEVRDVGEASTSQLVHEVATAKRSRHSSTTTSSSATTPIDQPVKKKSTARKSTQNLSSVHRHRWAADRAKDFAAAAEAEGSDNLTHEEAMRRAAVERRRSQSIRKASHSPTKSNAEAGPGPSTAPRQHVNLGPPKGIDTSPENEAIAVASPILIQSSSPDPISLPLAVQIPNAATEGESPIPVSAPASSSERAKPSPFQICDTPGSWGSAIPMAVPQSSRPRSHTPKAVITKLDTAIAGPSNSQRAPGQSNPTIQPAPQVTADVSAQTTKPARKGPTWKTSESPPPPAPQVLTVDEPSQPPEMDELNMEEASINDTRATCAEPSLAASVLQPGVRGASVTGHNADLDVVMPTNEIDEIDYCPPPPRLPAQQPDFEPDAASLSNAVTPPTDVPESLRPTQETELRTIVGEEPISAVDVSEPTASETAIGSDILTAASHGNIDDAQAGEASKAKTIASARGGVSVVGAAAAAAHTRWTKWRIDKEERREAHENGKYHERATTPMTFAAEIEDLLPSSNLDTDIAMDLPPSGDLTDLDAALLNLVQAQSVNGVDHAIVIDDSAESLPDDMNHIDLSRSRASSSGGSFEEIPAEIARTQIVFSRPATQTSKHVTSSQVVDQIARISATPQPEAGSSQPKRLKLKGKERADSNSSASSGSPSKRLSTRLASRTLTPVYNFGRSRSPIKWRQTVEMDGESDVEDLLRAPSRAESSGSSSMTIDGIERTLTATFNIPIVDSSPPPERRSRALRDFDTRLIDEWNKMSPTLTHNPALHRLIFESYIDQCVDGNEPEIKVYNTVDLESIPPHFEFQYSNNMLYNEHVPEPELGLGCDCEGGCSEISETCSCLKRQTLYNFKINDGFAYGKRGNLKQPVPIWECGPTCGCPPECMNRVVQRGRTDKALIDLFKTKKKGWGVRARSAIAAGTFLGIYAGEVIPETESERRGFIYERAGRTYLFDCDGYQIANPPEGIEKVDSRLAVLARDSAARAAEAAKEGDPSGTYNAYSIDAFHYGFTRYFNHSCDPNLQIVQAYVNDFHPERPLLVIFTLYHIKAGEELCISYKGLPDEEEEVLDNTKKSGKRRKIKKPKTTAAVHVVNKKGGLKEKDICYCGAYNCDGIMFNRATK